MKLYSYQENCLLAIESDPSHSQLISMPTGTGKTITFLSAILRKNKNCLVLVHRNELLQQTLEKAQLLGFSKDDISVITSEDKAELKKLTIAMVPTLVRNLSKYDSSFIEMIVVDEAHHAMAKSYLDIFSHFKIFEEKKVLLGFTATPLRGDKKTLGSIFLSHSFKMTLSEATQQGYICPVYGMRIDIQKSLEKIDTSQGDYDISQLDKVMNCESINELVANKLEHLHRSPAIVFCTSVDHAKKISILLRKKKRKAISISYNTPEKAKTKIFQLLKEKRIEFITNAVKLSEGFDHPPIQSIILVRPTRSPVLYKQMIGRGLRLSEGKLDCLVLEFSGNDPKMIRWEDIDENCTFQSITNEQRVSIKEAKNFYKQKFQNNITVLDVRVSPFSFYECKIRRMFRYKERRIIPFERGFLVFEFRRKKKPKNSDVYGSEAYCWMLFWKEKYKSFYQWCGGGPLWEHELGWRNEELEKQAIHYCECQEKEGNYSFGKWYPSEEQSMTSQQKSFLINPIKMNARKAEMFIEEACIKKAIDLFWIDSQIPFIEDPIFQPGQLNQETIIYQLTGKY